MVGFDAEKNYVDKSLVCQLYQPAACNDVVFSFNEPAGRPQLKFLPFVSVGLLLKLEPSCKARRQKCSEICLAKEAGNNFKKLTIKLTIKLQVKVDLKI